MRISDWSSDVCSSDLDGNIAPAHQRDDLTVEIVGHAGWQRPAQHHEIALRGFKLVKTGLPLGGLDGRPRWNEAIFLAAFELEHGGCDAGMARDIDAIVDELMEVRTEEHTSELQSLMRISEAV